MYLKPVFLVLSVLVAASTHAAEQPQSVQPAAAEPAEKVGLPRRVLAPTVHVLRATRQADGSLAVDCVQRPNPRLIKPAAVNSPRRNGGEP